MRPAHIHQERRSALMMGDAQHAVPVGTIRPTQHASITIKAAVILNQSQTRSGYV
jgi:hypothetical protein